MGNQELEALRPSSSWIDDRFISSNEGSLHRASISLDQKTQHCGYKVITLILELKCVADCTGFGHRNNPEL